MPVDIRIVCMFLIVVCFFVCLVGMSLLDFVGLMKDDILMYHASRYCTCMHIFQFLLQ